ncbi:MAG: TonB-dependent receptor, partial [bacterium]|nr:TonB-dependent receptor [bacterium]
GLHIDQASARGSVSSVYMRGGDPNFTVVLIDGVKVNDPTNSRGGSFDFSTLNTENIERIEIVRGPLSAVYGSDAMSGAINIITRQGQAKATRQVEVAGGRYEYLRLAAEVQGMVGVMDYAARVAYVDNGEPVEQSEFDNITLYTNLGTPLADNMELRWVLRYADSDSEAFPDFSGGPDLAVIREVEERDIQELTLGFNLTHEPFSWWTYHFQLGIYNRSEDVTSPGVAPGEGNPFSRIPPSSTDATFWRYDLNLRNVFPIVQGVQVALGAQLQIEDGTSKGSQDLTAFGFGVVSTNFELTRDIWAPFFEIQLTLVPGLMILGGVRVDIPEGFDAEVSPRLGAAYTIATTNTTLRANWGEGFKLPSFFALGFPPPVGNPDLVPETSWSVDAGVTQILWGERVSVSATYFYNEFDHLIDFDTAAFQLVNRDAVSTAGVEMSLMVQPWPVFDFTAHLTYVKTDIKGTDAELRNRPQWRGGAAVRWRPKPAFDLTLRGLVVGDILDASNASMTASNPTGEQMLDAYVRFDFAATWRLNTTWQFFLAVDNLFDADYEEAIGFPAPGIRPRGGVRARL